MHVCGRSRFWSESCSACRLLSGPRGEEGTPKYDSRVKKQLAKSLFGRTWVENASNMKDLVPFAAGIAIAVFGMSFLASEMSPVWAAQEFCVKPTQSTAPILILERF